MSPAGARRSLVCCLSPPQLFGYSRSARTNSPGSTVFSLSGKATFIQTFIAFRFGCVLSPGVASYSFIACQNTLEERFNVEFIALWPRFSFFRNTAAKKSLIKSRLNVPFSFQQVIKSQIHKIHNMLKMKPCIQIILSSVIIAVHV